MNTNSAIITLTLIVLLCGQDAGAAQMDMSAMRDATLAKVDPKLIELASDENVVEPAKLTDSRMKMMVSNIETIPTTDAIVITSERYDLSRYMDVKATSESRVSGTYRTFGSLQVDSNLMHKLLKIASINEVVSVNSLQPVDAPEPQTRIWLTRLGMRRL